MMSFLTAAGGKGPVRIPLGISANYRPSRLCNTRVKHQMAATRHTVPTRDVTVGIESVPDAVSHIHLLKKVMHFCRMSKKSKQMKQIM